MLSKEKIEKIRENITIGYTSRKESKDIFREGRERLFLLILDHPYFHKQVKKIRKVQKIPENGFKTREEVLVWEHSTKNKK